MLGSAARGLADAGAEFLVIATNTMHIVADQIEAAAGIPVLHIADPTADAIIAAGVDIVGLLGTRFTMEKAFYRERLEARGLTVLVPDADDRRRRCTASSTTNSCSGVVRDESRAEYRAVMQRLVDRGATGIIAGLHRDHHAGRPGRLDGAAVRHDRAARPRGGRASAALISTRVHFAGRSSITGN